jgi:hypothetical protein
MKQDRKQEQARLLRFLKGRVGTLDIDHMLELLRLLREDAKDNLLTCSQEEFSRVQAEGMTYEKLIRSLTRPDIVSTDQAGVINV